MSRFTIEKDWTTAAGFRAVVTMGSMGFRCGYVGVPVGHALHGADYTKPTAALAAPAQDEEIGKRNPIGVMCAAFRGGWDSSPQDVFNVHGGITFADGDGKYPVESDLWWFGYDCGHSGDGRSDEYKEKMRLEYPDKSYMWHEDFDDVHRTLDYCERECESLARQIVVKTVVAP